MLQSVPDHIARPFQRGYDRFESFLGLFFNGSTPPGLQMGLDVLEEQGATDRIFASLPSNARCLIEGFSTPTNGLALKQFLQRRGISDPHIQAIDICNSGAIFEASGIGVPEVDFTVADAADLRDLIDDEQIDLLVQDGLLNCAPPELHRAILSEAVRVLRPHGLLIANYTDNHLIQELEVVESEELEEAHGFVMDWQAYSLRDLTQDEQALPLLKNRAISCSEQKHFAVVTPPYGYFEFFTCPHSMQALFEECGLEVLLEVNALQQDSNGFPCRRYRSVLRKKA